VSPGAFRRPDDCAEVVHVGNLVANNDQRRFASVPGNLQNFGDIHIGFYGDKGNHALVRMGNAHGIELSSVRVNNNGTGLSRFGGDMTQRFVRLTLEDINLVDGPPGPEGFDNGVATPISPLRIRQLRPLANLGSSFYPPVYGLMRYGTPPALPGIVHAFTFY
jgi:hypothetical protein